MADQDRITQDRQEREADAIHTEHLQEKATQRAEIKAAIGWLQNLLDSEGTDWADDTTLAGALAGAGEWAHDAWPNYLEGA